MSDLTCAGCGNVPEVDGFDVVLADGTEVEPVVDGPWDGHYRCRTCGTILQLPRTFVIEPVGTPVGTSWRVVEDGVVRLVDNALGCLAWCEREGAVRRGPRVYVLERQPPLADELQTRG